MITSYLYDTSVLIAILRRNPDIEQRRQAAPGVPYVNAVALGELLKGAKHSSRVTEGLREVRLLISTMRVLPVDETTADIYSDISHDLATRGQMIPDNDIWIAATALQYGLTLASRDAHFTRIAGLAQEQW